MRSMSLLLLWVALMSSVADEKIWESEQQKECIIAFEKMLAVHAEFQAEKKVERAMCSNFGEGSSACLQTKAKVAVLENNWNHMQKSESGRWDACQDSIYHSLPRFNDRITDEVENQVTKETHDFYIKMILSLHQSENFDEIADSPASVATSPVEAGSTPAEIVTLPDTETLAKSTTATTAAGANPEARSSEKSYWWQQDGVVAEDSNIEPDQADIPQIAKSEPEYEPVENVQQHMSKPSAHTGLPVGMAVLIGVLVGLAVAGALVGALVFFLRRLNKKTDLDNSLQKKPQEDGINFTPSYNVRSVVNSGSIVVI